MAGRKSKLTAELQTQLTQALAAGVTDAEACASAGIGSSTFYLWLEIGTACLEEKPHERKPKSPRSQKPYVEFVEAVTRARAQAQISAIKAFASGLSTTEMTETTTETVIETRLKKDGQSYDYKRTFTRERKVSYPPDWRAGEAWLKRRDPEHWSEKAGLDVTSGGQPLKPGLTVDDLALLFKQIQEQKEALRGRSA